MVDRRNSRPGTLQTRLLPSRRVHCSVRPEPCRHNSRAVLRGDVPFKGNVHEVQHQIYHLRDLAHGSWSSRSLLPGLQTVHEERKFVLLSEVDHVRRKQVYLLCTRSKFGVWCVVDHNNNFVRGDRLQIVSTKVTPRRPRLHHSAAAKQTGETKQEHPQNGGHSGRDFFLVFFAYGDSSVTPNHPKYKYM